MAIITARISHTVSLRAEELGITHVYQGQGDKRACLRDLLDALHLAPEQAAFIGDDLTDLAPMGIAGLAGWPLWAGFLVVALLLSAVGFIALSSGRRKLRTFQAIPEQTVTTLKENSEWIAKRLSSAQR